MLKFEVSEAEAGERADVFLAQKLTNYSRASLKGLFDKGLVKINSGPARAGQKIKNGDRLEADISLLKLTPTPIELPVIYEDDDVIVMDKPAGILTHCKGALNEESTVASFLAGKINDKKLTGNRAGIVHRLDRGTSGVIIGARNEPTLKWLQKQFSTRKTVKKYLAVAEGDIEPAEAIIDAPIGRNVQKPQTFKVLASGKPAQTQYKVLKTFHKGGQKYSLVELTPRTGRTHQLRVHMAYIGHQIVGDPVYGRGNGPIMLHAESLEISLPHGQKKTFTAKTPAKFVEFTNGN